MLSFPRRAINHEYPKYSSPKIHAGSGMGKGKIISFSAGNKMINANTIEDTAPEAPTAE